MDHSGKERPKPGGGSRPVGRLYLVATPIGNLGDLSFRALETLQGVEMILCEDTRKSRRLLDHYGIAQPLVAFHAHNESQRAEAFLDRLMAGESMALISDAGTPLINDPGFPLVSGALERGISVVPIPGPCALIAALVAAGLPTHRFAFEGFPPRRSSARRRLFETLAGETRTLVFYESAHRLMEMLADLEAVFPGTRRLVIAREMTKHFETFLSLTVAEARDRLSGDPDQQKGEFVIVLEGAPEQETPEDQLEEALRVLDLLLTEVSPSSAARLAAQITGAKRPWLYDAALRRTGRRDSLSDPGPGR